MVTISTMPSLRRGYLLGFSFPSPIPTGLYVGIYRGVSLMINHDLTYEWRDSKLYESDSRGVRLRVTLDDYESVISALRRWVDEYNLFRVGDLCMTAKRIDGTSVPMTHVYTCVRYWSSLGRVRKTAGRKMVVCEPS